LRDLRIVSLAVNLPGPLACAQLAARGAHVTRIEPPAGDPLRFASPQWYDALTAGQAVVTLDLTKPDARDELDGFLTKADLLITASRPASLDRFGLAWTTLHERFPDLCAVAIFGETGAGAQSPGHDLTYQAHAGILTPPQMPRALASDFLGAQHAVSAALDALLERERFGGGVYREVSLADAATALAEPVRYNLTSPGGVLGGVSPYYQLYRTSDGWIALAALEPQFRSRLLQQLSLKTDTYDSFAVAFARETSAHWEAFALRHDLPIAAVKDAAHA
jgi:crotonobetainyl-CoA:carnitine CoA-transferase CaiB-like acyl-CoA transferase